MTKVSLNTSALKDKILSPISRVIEDCILTIEKNKIQSIATLGSGSIIVLAEHTIDQTIDSPITLNIKPINKLISVLNCVTDDKVTMKIESNHIKYDSKNFKFKFHLTEDGVITKPRIKKKKIIDMEFETSASLDLKSFNALMKSSAYLTGEQASLYFYTKAKGEERGIYCDITNKGLANSDSITLKISDDFDGEPVRDELICDVEYIRKLAIDKHSDLKIYFNSTIGYTAFDVLSPSSLIRYIIPTLSK